MRHLLVQTDVLESLVKLVNNPDSLDDFTTLMRDITDKQRLHLLWEQCAGGHYLNTSADSVVTQLKARYVHYLKKFTETETQDGKSMTSNWKKLEVRDFLCSVGTSCVSNA